MRSVSTGLLLARQETTSNIPSRGLLLQQLLLGLLLQQLLLGLLLLIGLVSPGQGLEREGSRKDKVILST